ncbi:hypothetical protein QFZ31_004464 [Neobacillus niacini]|uniref:hypothetical protein n=1 Tax=Neobacillus driksii TaxID=3035913 RepID=UPI00278160B0|nr:hypothetical protein [Neobacillus niacini]MDQ0974586.1 hypothetical protein [Neobacillus niacini]
MIHLKDPLCFKESITISLEALSGMGIYEHLRDIVDTIPSTVNRMCLGTSRDIEESLGSCIDKFKETKTYHYLREDFKNALYDIEIQLNKKVS